MKWQHPKYANFPKNSKGEPCFYTEEEMLESMEPDQHQVVPDVLDLIYIEQSLNIQFTKKQQEIFQRCRNVLSKTVHEKGADLPPFKPDIDEDKWNSKARQNANRRPRFNDMKAKAAKESVDKLLKNKIIRVASTAQHGSNLLLIIKPDGSFRPCVDYRILNDCTSNEGMGWPIPNIEQMLDRLGSQHAKYFGVIDLTAGYHQTWLDPAVVKLTAFLTYSGMYEWLRVPMGLKGAPSYFQRMMATIVLAGLVERVCEVYLDDIIIYGRTEEEYLTNLETVLKALEKRRIMVNPSKVRSGLTAIEFVGHVIDEEGTHFTRDKIDSVLNFPKPILAGQLKSFIGLCNFFRNNVEGMSVIQAPLTAMLDNYTKAKQRVKLQWTTETTAAFENLRSAIDVCPKLFFVNYEDIHNSRIVLKTDACDYGFGAILTQQIGEEEHVIGIYSKSFTREQYNWPTIQKEAYAIHYALQKWEYLLRDVYFLIRTDHKNLTFVNSDSNPMVQRWKLAMQQYRCDVEHIAGNDNFIADALSRLIGAAPALEEHVLCVLEIEEKIEEVTGMIDGILARLDLPAQDAELVAVNYDEVHIPQAVYVLLQKHHNAADGHFGVKTTIQKLNDLESAQLQRLHVNQSQLRKYVAKFIYNCPTCQKLRHLREKVKTLPFTLSANQPFERINVDTIGPLTETKDGYKYILVIIDSFSRWVELTKLKTLEPEEAATALLEFMGRYGNPRQLLTDRGTQFVNNVVSELVEKLAEIDKVISIAHSKEENGLVERANKEVVRHLSAIIQDVKILAEWDVNLPFVQRIINTKIHESTGLAPCQVLMPGVETERMRAAILKRPRADADADQDDQQEEDSDEESDGDNELRTEYARALFKRQRLVTLVAQETQNILNGEHLYERALPQGDDPTEFPPNSFVLRSYPNGRMGRLPPKKLMAPQEGPFRVIRNIGVEYFLFNLTTQKEEEPCHVSRLVRFNHDPNHTNPAVVAQADKQAFTVESILGFARRSNFKSQKKNLYFRVKWVGYEEETEEPWANLRTNISLHVWMRENNHAAHIPNDFR